MNKREEIEKLILEFDFAGKIFAEEEEEEEEVIIVSLKDITERKWMEDALKLSVERLAALSRATQVVTASLELNQVLAEILSLAGKVAGSDYTSVALVDEAGRLSESAEEVPGVPSIKHRIRDEGFTNWIIRSRQAVVIDEIGEDGAITHDLGEGAPRFANPLIVEAGVKSFAGLPLMTKDRLLGMLYLYSLRPGVFQGQLPLLTAFANQASIAIENARLYRESDEARRRYQDLYDNAPVMYHTIDTNGIVLECNQTEADMLGYSKEEIIGKPIYAFETEEYQELAPDALREAIEKGYATGERRFVRKDGTVIDTALEARAIYDDSGKVVGFRSTLTDITEHKRLEEQLLQSQKMEAIGRLAGGVAHDFNNMLTAITGYSDLALISLGQDDPLRKNIEEIKKAGERAASLTRQLLAFSRRQTLQPETLNLNTVVGDVEKMLQRLIGEDIDLITQLEPELEPVKADPGRMQQIIMNLAVNARDAMLQGGKLTIKTENVTIDEEHSRFIHEAREGEFVCLSVADTGIGMDKETIGHIFEPFFTTKKAGEGTGLGLSVIYGIVKQHEGWIEVHSELGEGSTFAVYLPVFSIELEDETKETISLKDLQGNGERILLVEDEELIRKLATTGLSESGYIVFEAVNAEEALNIFERENGNFHLVFSDVVLPDESGLQLVDQLLSLEPKLKVLFSSGYTDEKSQWHLIREKGFRFLEKPYALSDLLRAIREAIEQAK